MRNFKKISAIFVVIAMMLTMVSVNVFAAVDGAALTVKVTKTADAADATAITDAKSGSTVYVKYYLTAGTYSAAQIQGNIPGTAAQADVVAETGGTVQVFDNEDGTSEVFVTWGSGITATDAPILTVPVTIPVSTPETNDFVLFTALDNAFNNPLPTPGNVNATINVKAAWQIASDNVEDKAVDFGTADPALPTSIKVSKEATFADAGSETRTVEWACAEYDATVPDDYTFTATFTDTDDDSLLGIVGEYAPTATVTVNPVTVEAGDIVLPDDGYILMYSEDIADLAAVAASLPTSYEVSVTVDEETFTAMVPVTWTAALNEANAEATAPYEVGTLFDLTGALTAGPIADTVFTVAADQTIATTVEITPAEVVGSSIAVEMKGYTQKPEVTVTLPANTLYIVSTTTEGEGEDAVTTVDYGTITVTFTGEGDDPVTGTATYEVTEEDYLANTGEGAAAVELTAKATDYLKTMGFQVGDSITVTADYEGAAILSGETEEGGAEKAESFVVKSVITGGGSQVGGAGATGAVKNYLINVAEATNGTVAVSKDNAAKGTVITVTTTPAEGYKTEKITVKDKDGIDIPVDQDAKTFTMPGKDVTVSATFVEGEEVVAPVETTYTDVTAEHWAYEAIEALAAAGIVNGNPDGTFAPDNAITRAELTKMIVNVFGVEAASLETGFVDCPADAWFTPYVAAAKEAGYVTGVSETEFAPEALVTREQACAILGRALNATSETALTFTDAASVEAYAAPYVAALVDLGIVNGYAGGSFAPANSITRAEAAKIIAGAMAIIEAIEAPVEEEAAEEVATEEATEEAAEETTEEVVEEEAADAVVEEEATEEAVEETTEEVVDEK